MATDKIIDYEVMSLDENGNIETDGSVTATGGIVGDVTGINLGDGRTLYSSDGAIDVENKIVQFTASSGALSMTLADGKEGQIMYMLAINNDTNDVVVTPEHLYAGGATTITFTEVRQTAILAFNSSSWMIMYTNATVA